MYITRAERIFCTTFGCAIAFGVQRTAFGSTVAEGIISATLFVAITLGVEAATLGRVTVAVRVVWTAPAALARKARTIRV